MARRSVRFPPRPKPAHHRGTYHQRALAVRTAAKANPLTTCWQCGRMAHEFLTHRNGAPAKWTAGHKVDGQVGGELVPECSVCNLQRGARLGNLRSQRNTTPRPASRRW
jgi:hypothetical protein